MVGTRFALMLYFCMVAHKAVEGFSETSEDMVQFLMSQLLDL